jgi:hypothetical protein
MVDDPSAYVEVLRADPKLRRKAESALKARLKLWEEARGGETYVAEVRQRVDALRASQEGVQSLRGQLTEAVIVRRQRDREASESLRHLAAVVRAKFGFANPVIESFNIRSEHRAKKSRKPKPADTAAVA